MCRELNELALVLIPNYYRKFPFPQGWGKIRHPGSSHNILQQALMPIRGKQECADRLAKSPNGSRLKITDQMVCAGYTSSSSVVSGCHGDSGGPLVCQKPTGEFQLHGAVSWGSPRYVSYCFSFLELTEFWNFLSSVCVGLEYFNTPVTSESYICKHGAILRKQSGTKNSKLTTITVHNVPSI